MALQQCRTAWPGRCYDALAFLTRLVPPRSGCTGSDLGACLPCYGPAGLCLGLTLALPAWLFWLLLQQHPQAVPLLCAALAAWLWMGLEVWSTRSLHWDGLADLGDACGSGAQGERFWAIMKDSRLGAFGALHLLLAFGGMWLVVCWHIYSSQWLWLVVAPAWGRVCALWLAASAPPRDKESLGGLTCAGASPALTRRYALAALLVLVALALFAQQPWWRVAVTALGQYILIRRMAAFARSKGGISGDFLGAGIQWGQLWFLASTV